MKHNIVRYFVETHDVTLVVVPHDYDLEANPQRIAWDGVFCSNGPGDPQQCAATIKSLRYAMTRDQPIFGICLGNQLLALAAGATTYKMKYGNRGMNQPCVDLRTTRCYITSQNHGYAVDDQSLPEGWKALFVNANDRADSASSLNLNLLSKRRRRAVEASTSSLRRDARFPQARTRVLFTSPSPSSRSSSTRKRPADRLIRRFCSRRSCATCGARLRSSRC